MLSGVTIVTKDDAQREVRREAKKEAKREKKKKGKRARRTDSGKAGRGDGSGSGSDDSGSDAPRPSGSVNPAPNLEGHAEGHNTEHLREDWMTGSSFGEASAKGRDSKSSVQLKRDEDSKRAAEIASQRELNPFWKNGGDGKPPGVEPGFGVGGNEGGTNTTSNDTGKQSGQQNRHAVSSHLSAGVSGGVGDGGASWRLKALKRAKERSLEEGRSLAEVVGDRWGSVGDLVESIGHSAAHAKAHLKRRGDGCFTCGEKGHLARDCPSGGPGPLSGGTNATGTNKRERSSVDEDEDIARARRRANGGGGQNVAGSTNDTRMRKPEGLRSEDKALLQSASRDANKFVDDGSFMKRFETGGGGAAGTGDGAGMGKQSERVGGDVSVEGKKTEPDFATQETGSDFAQTQRPQQPSRSTAGVAPVGGSSNMSAAAALRQRLMGKAGTGKQSEDSDTTGKHALPLVTEDGRAAPGAFGRATTLAGGVSSAEGAIRKVPKTTQRFDVDKKETEKVRYFRDDDDATLRDLVAAEKHGDPRKGNYDLNYADNISRDKRYKGHTTEKDRDEAYDDEYDNDAGLEAYESRDKKQSDAKRQEKARQRQVFEYEKSEKDLKKCGMCLGNDNKRDKHLHVAYGNSAYLMLPARGRLVPGHCVIAPIAHCDSSRNVDEGTWEEMRNFKKCLVLMFAKQGEECCFIETVCSGSGGSGGGGGLGARFAGSGGSSVAGNPKLPHTFVECVPLPRDVAESAPAYFKKAIDESESEWATHAGKRCLCTAPPKGLRQTIPTNFPYFHCEFGMKGGFAHVIDDTRAWRNDFGRDVLCGLLHLPPNAQKRALPPRVLKKEMEKFLDGWDVVDWTKQL